VYTYPACSREYDDDLRLVGSRNCHVQTRCIPECSVNLYTFKLEQFHIDNTRSRHQDTDTATFALQIGNQQSPVQSFFAGDVNNGDHAVNLAFKSTLISDDNTPAVFTYEIYNGDAGKLPTDLETMAKTLAAQVAPLTEKTTGADSGIGNFSSGEAGADVPNQDDPFQDSSGWSKFFLEAMVVAIGSFLFPDCDGFVAADGIGRTKSQWDSLIDSAGGATFRKVMHYPGSDSPSGCGSNSDYTVTWSVTREKVTGSMRQFFKARGLALHPGVRSLG
jgi:hypothetical protein